MGSTGATGERQDSDHLTSEVRHLFLDKFRQGLEETRGKCDYGEY